ncbi:flagellar basal-body MS-ring/collar protein FliF [Cupriavidus sp. 30B13]|uniref:flagellar basal-body MS-ring/collar protein FliF n=1 Tax=Cupriavidus sp. 30B13 TaxID=3384241 RepID=UPI003B91C4CA
MLKEFWNGLSRVRRAGLGIGAAAIVAATVFAGVWLLPAEDQVLFADLAPQDAAVMTAELDRMKVPYRLSNDGSTILTDGDVVHKTRLKLMGKELPLHGGVGFELFNGGDFGMTEFAQKVNYQRALQGELTRTILSISDVKAVRVHIALPEDGLFKRNDSKPKASVTLALKDGKTLAPEQTTGIQRLVSASIAGLVSQDVTILNEQGVALTRAVQSDGGSDGSARLDLKRDTENALAKKAVNVLERTFGAGQVVASVDVTLSMDAVRITTEDVVGTPGRGNQALTGVVVRERESNHDGGAPLSVRDGVGGSAQREVEYQVGKRVEQVIGQPGAVKRMQVLAVIKRGLSPEQIEQAKAMLATATGAMAERGDVVLVQTMSAYGADMLPDDASPSDRTDTAAAATPASERASGHGDAGTFGPGLVLSALLAAVLFGGFGWWLGRLRSGARAGVATMTGAEREAMLAQLRSWLNDPGQGHGGDRR